MINCVVCGKETPASTRGKPKKYCSRECAYPRKTKPNTHCVQCGVKLLPTHAGRPRVTCSRDCRNKKANALAKTKRQQRKNCTVCQTSFTTGKKSQRFCSYDCRYLQWKADNPHQRNTEPKEIICGWCNGTLIVPPSFTGSRKYHDECRVRARRANYRIKTVRRQSLTVKPSRLSADQLVDAMGAVCGICKDPIDMTLKRTSRMGLTVDHIIPLSKGGQDTLDNMQPAHWLCNVKKGNKIDA